MTTMRRRKKRSCMRAHVFFWRVVSRSHIWRPYAQIHAHLLEPHLAAPLWRVSGMQWLRPAP